MDSKHDWRIAVEDKKERQVMEAVENPQWDFRTADGIAQETGLPAEEVEQILEQLKPWIRKSPVRDVRGRVLYALRTRPKPASEWVEQAKAFLSKRGD